MPHRGIAPGPAQVVAGPLNLRWSRRSNGAEMPRPGWRPRWTSVHEAWYYHHPVTQQDAWVVGADGSAPPVQPSVDLEPPAAFTGLVLHPVHVVDTLPPLDYNGQRREPHDAPERLARGVSRGNVDNGDADEWQFSEGRWFWTSPVGRGPHGMLQVHADLLSYLGGVRGSPGPRALPAVGVHPVAAQANEVREAREAGRYTATLEKKPFKSAGGGAEVKQIGNTLWMSSVARVAQVSCCCDVLTGRSERPV